MFDPVTSEARAIAQFFYLVLGICAAIFAVVVGLLAAALARRRREGAWPARASSERRERRWEWAWTITPLLIVSGVFVLAWKVAGRADPTRLDAGAATEVIVRGHQWWWQVEHPASGVKTANEVHVPVGQPVHIQLQSADVIHDFWVPRLSRKVDVTPGRVTQLRFRVERAGRYAGACAEFCGTQHAWMRFDVVALDHEAWSHWLEAQARPAKQPMDRAGQAGLAVWRRETCDRCHTIKGISTSAPAAVVGPDLTHLMSRRALAGGALPNNIDHLRAWLADPSAYKPGSHMPDFHLGADDLDALTAFLGGLR